MTITDAEEYNQKQIEYSADKQLALAESFLEKAKTEKDISTSGYFYYTVANALVYYSRCFDDEELHTSDFDEIGKRIVDLYKKAVERDCFLAIEELQYTYEGGRSFIKSQFEKAEEMRLYRKSEVQRIKKLYWNEIVEKMKSLGFTYKSGICIRKEDYGYSYLSNDFRARYMRQQMNLGKLFEDVDEKTAIQACKKELSGEFDLESSQPWGMINNPFGKECVQAVSYVNFLHRYPEKIKTIKKFLTILNDEFLPIGRRWETGDYYGSGECPIPDWQK